MWIVLTDNLMNKPQIEYIQELILENRERIAFIMGNGVNRYREAPETLSWDKLLLRLWEQTYAETLSSCPPGMTLTEFYDILEMDNKKNVHLQKEVVNLMDEWAPQDHHRLIVEGIQALDVPLLTTNFDATLAKSVGCSPLRITKEGFSHQYPWSDYYGTKQLDAPCDGFGIWHINGMCKYPGSIRLGLCHYMGSVEKTRKMVSKEDDNLYHSQYKGVREWLGYRTWLDIIFNRSLFIFGLALEENEVFLRWLLIQRKMYFNKFNLPGRQGWYLYKKEDPPISMGKRLFLERVGFTFLELETYDDMYDGLWQGLGQ